MRRSPFALLSLLAAMPTCVLASGFHEMWSLKGLYGVAVVIESLDEDARSLGLTEEELQVVVELGLRRSGIRVFSKEELLNDDRGSYLYVRVTASPSAAYVTVELNQSAQLLNGEYFTGVTTWSSGALLTGRELAKRILDEIARRVDGFAIDYSQANPKK